MEDELTRKQIRRAIKRRVFDLEEAEALTSKGEPVSFAAIGRTCTPPVARSAVSLVVSGDLAAPRIRAAVECELGMPFWIKRKSA